MSLSPRLKLGLLAFVLIDVALVVLFVNLMQVRAERQSLEALREIGVTVYPEPRPLTDFVLSDQHGEEFTASDFIGQWNLVFFGFTSCPDICPLTMAELGQFYEGLSPTEASQVRVLMVSVDPDRDTPTAMGEYMASFNEDFVGLTGNSAVITGLARQFFVAHSEPSQPEHAEHAAPDEGYLIEHSGHLAIVNPAGEFYGVISPPIRDRDLERAYQTILAD